MGSSDAKPVRIGLLGAGAMGAEHAYCYGQIAGAEVVGVFSRTPARAAEAARPLGARAFDDALALIQDPDVEAVDVSLPTPAHGVYVLAALRAGKHVFCETPMTLDPEEGRRMRDAARAAGKLLQVGLLMRSVAPCALVRRFVETGEHGRLLSLTAYRLGSYLRPEAPDSKPHYSDPTTELMTFDLDFVGWVMGAPARVQAEGVTWRDGLAEASALLSFEDGRSATVLASGMKPVSFPFTTGFAANFEQATLETETVIAGGEVSAVSRLYLDDGAPRTPELAPVNPYQLELERFVACVRGEGDASLLDADRALEALDLSIAVQMSIAERRPVTPVA